MSPSSRCWMFISRVLVLMAALVAPSMVWAGPDCTVGDGLIDETLASGARWQMCWEERSREGIILEEIFYTPPGGSERMILERLSLAQIHVPYDDNGARFHDVTDYGAGGGNLQALTTEDCPGGHFLVDGSKNVACKQILPRGADFDLPGMQLQGEMLSIFSVSPIGEYNYIPKYQFEDGGAIEVRMGATGALQRFDNGLGSNSPTSDAWPLDATGDRHGISHIHNYYFRMDFDLAGTPGNDVVEQVEVIADGSALTRATQITQFTSEAATDVAPANLRTWRVREGSGGETNSFGHPVGYELVPLESGHRDEGPSFEPFTHNDFYVTKYSSCERYASHNDDIFECGENLQDFVSGESIVDEDIVVWYGLTFHHIPRDEDESRMHAHWNGFRLEPRDWSDATPTSNDVTSCAPGAIDFDDFAIQPYPGQDGSGLATSIEQGRTLQLTGDAWKRSVATYDIQVGTELHFEFASSIEGEIQALGLDVNAILGDQPGFFFLQGTQNWGNSGRIDITPDYGGAGAFQEFNLTLSDYFTGNDMHLVFINDKDSGAPTNDARFRCVRIVQPGAPPVWDDPGAQSNTEGDVVSLALSATDPNGNGVTYSAPSLPSGLMLDGNGGVISGTLDYTAASGSPYSITITADNGSQASDLILGWTVANLNRTPVWVTPATQMNAEGDAVNLTLMATDPDGEDVTYSVSGLPAGLGLTAATGLIDGNIDYTASALSPYTITATATDGSSPIDQVFSWVVTNTNQAPIWVDPGAQNNVEGDAISLQLQASDPDGQGVTFSSTALPDGLSLDSVSGLIDGTLSYTSAANSPYSVTATSTDGTAPSDMVIPWVVSNTNRAPVWVGPGNQNNTEGDVVALQLMANDLDFDDIVSYGAMGLPPGLILNPVTGLISGTVDEDAAATGPIYSVTVTAMDGSLNVDEFFDWTILSDSIPQVPSLSPAILRGLVVLIVLVTVGFVYRRRGDHTHTPGE